jgi:hypothetical protein
MRSFTIITLVGAALVSLALVSCESGSGIPGIGGETPRHALTVFCSLKQSAIGQVLLTPEQIAAGRVVCAAVGAGMGNPG